MKRKQQDDTMVSEVQQDDTVVSEVQPVGCTRQCPEADESGSEVSMGLLPMVGLVYCKPFAHHAVSGSKDKELCLTAPPPGHGNPPGPPELATHAFPVPPHQN